MTTEAALEFYGCKIFTMKTGMKNGPASITKHRTPRLGGTKHSDTVESRAVLSAIGQTFDQIERRFDSMISTLDEIISVMKTAKNRGGANA